MPIAREDRKVGESTVSRYMQIKVPDGSLLEGAITNPTNVTTDDLIDGPINKDLLTIQVLVSSLTLKKTDDSYNLEDIGEGTTIEEKDPFSSQSQYNKMKVVFDRDQHIFLFDYTPGNNRTLLHHPSGAYFLIDNKGGYTFVTKDDSINFIGGTESHYITGDRNKRIDGDKNEQIVGEYKLAVDKNFDFNVVGSMTSKLGHEHKNIDGDSITIIDGGLESFSQYRNEKVVSFYNIAANEMYFKSKGNFIIETGSMGLLLKGNSTESVGGLKSIDSSALALSTSNSMFISAGIDLSITSMGSSEEIIMGALPIPLTPFSNAKKIEIKLGSYLLDVLTGDINLETLKGFGPKLELSGSTQTISLSTLLGGLNVTPVGSLTLFSDVAVSLGSSTAIEPLILGTSWLNWESVHTHGTGVGPSSVPLQASTLINLLSKKVFTE